MSSTTHDVIVIGAGPAGISAALTASSHGLETLLLDEQPSPGGQIYRNITRVPPSVATLLGPDYRYGAILTEQLARSNVELVSGAMVWDVARDLTVTAHREGRSFQARAPQLIAATGAMERSSPIPGWTLPGVLNAGAAQVALKSAGAVPRGRVVLAGGGPLLLLVACQLLEAGVTLAGIVETLPASNRLRALPYLPLAIGAPSYLAKGLRMLRYLDRAAGPRFSAATKVRIEGNDKVKTLAFAVKGVEKRLDADVVLLHHGVVPNTQLSRLLKIDHDWDATQLAWHPRVDAWGGTSLPGFRIAGDGTAIGGALASQYQGALAALGAVRDLGRLSAADCERHAAPLRRSVKRQLRIRSFLDALYRPPDWLSSPDDGTTVCRCEEVMAGQVREMARLGCRGPNQTKFFTRCGMGPCQGRICGLTVTRILSEELGKPPQEIGSYHVRSPLKPIPLASIAALADE